MTENEVKGGIGTDNLCLISYDDNDDGDDDDVMTAHSFPTIIENAATKRYNAKYPTNTPTYQTTACQFRKPDLRVWR